MEFQAVLTALNESITEAEMILSLETITLLELKRILDEPQGMSEWVEKFLKKKQVPQILVTTTLQHLDHSSLHKNLRTKFGIVYPLQHQ